MLTNRVLRGRFVTVVPANRLEHFVGRVNSNPSAKLLEKDEIGVKQCLTSDPTVAECGFVDDVRQHGGGHEVDGAERQAETRKLHVPQTL